VDGKPKGHGEVAMGEAISPTWIEIFKIVGPAATVAIIFLWKNMSFTRWVLDRVEQREKTLLEFVEKHSATSATNTEVNRGLCERVGENTEAIHALGEKISLLAQKVGE